MLFAVPAALAGWGVAVEVSQVQTWPGSASAPGRLPAHPGGNGCGTWCLQGKPAPAPAQPLWGHILPVLPTASVHGCFILSASAAESGILFIPDLIPQMCICMPMCMGNGILSVTITRVTGLHCRLQRHTLTQVKKERNAAFNTYLHLA